MAKFKAATNLVNGGIINDLLELCNDQFSDSFIHVFYGLNQECKYCGVAKSNDGSPEDHHSTCPVEKYLAIAEKHKRWIVAK